VFSVVETRSLRRAGGDRGVLRRCGRAVLVCDEALAGGRVQLEATAEARRAARRVRARAHVANAERPRNIEAVPRAAPRRSAATARAAGAPTPARARRPSATRRSCATRAAAVARAAARTHLPAAPRCAAGSTVAATCIAITRACEQRQRAARHGHRHREPTHARSLEIGFSDNRGITRTSLFAPAERTPLRRFDEAAMASVCRKQMRCRSASTGLCRSTEHVYSYAMNTTTTAIELCLADQIAILAAQVDVGMHRLLTCIRQFDESDEWGHQGARTCADWLAWRIGLAPGAAREKVRVARTLAKLPAIDAAMASGRLSYAKVRALTRVATAANETRLVEIALAATGAQLERLCRRFRRVIDDGAIPGMEAAVDPSCGALGVRVRNTDAGT